MGHCILSHKDGIPYTIDNGYYKLKAGNYTLPHEFYVSTHSGDRTTINGRYAQKITNTPTIFTRQEISSGGWNGYHWISLSTDGLRYTGNDYSAMSTYKTYTSSNGTLYYSKMNDGWQYYYAVSVSGTKNITFKDTMISDGYFNSDYYNYCSEFFISILKQY